MPLNERLNEMKKTNQAIPGKEFSSVRFGVVYPQYAHDSKIKSIDCNPSSPRNCWKYYTGLQQREKCS